MIGEVEVAARWMIEPVMETIENVQRTDPFSTELWAKALVRASPAGAAIGLLSVAFAFRLLDLFVYRLDERWGEIIVSKAATCLLLLGFMRSTGRSFRAMGLHSDALGSTLVLAGTITASALFAAYAIEFGLNLTRGGAPTVIVTSVDASPALLLAGNIVNSFAEEGLFRGAMLPLLLARVPRLGAVAASALLFGAWHLPWAVKALLAGDDTSPTMLLASNFVPQAALGLVWGYLYLRTGNLWSVWLSHTLVNSTVNFIHLRTADAIDPEFALRMTVFTVLMLCSVPVIRRVAGRIGFPEVEAWPGCDVEPRVRSIAS